MSGVVRTPHGTYRVVGGSSTVHQILGEAEAARGGDVAAADPVTLRAYVRFRLYECGRIAEEDADRAWASFLRCFQGVDHPAALARKETRRAGARRYRRLREGALA